MDLALNNLKRVDMPLNKETLVDLGNNVRVYTQIIPTVRDYLG